MMGAHKLNYDENLKKFLDGGFVSYLSRAFSWDFNFKLHLQLAHHMSTRINLVRELPQTSPAQLAIEKDSFSEQQKKDTEEYNQLVNKLNNAKNDPHSLSYKLWLNLKKDILKYFKTGESIYRYYEGGPAKQKGYYYDCEKHTLKYFNGSKFTDVCVMSDETSQKAMEDIFPSVASKSRNIFSRILSPLGGVSLTPELHMSLINIAFGKDRTPLPTLPMPVGKDFLKILRKYEDFQNSCNMQDKLQNSIGGNLNEEQLIDDLVSNILDKCDVYINEGSPKHSKEKIAIMEGIKNYLEGAINKDKFDEIIKNNDKRYFRLFLAKSDAYRTLDLIGQVRSNPSFDEVLSSKNRSDDLVNKPKVEKSQRFETAVNLSEAKTKAREFWQDKRITKDAYSDMLDRLEACLSKENDKPENTDTSRTIISNMLLFIDSKKKQLISRLAESPDCENGYFQSDCELINTHFLEEILVKFNVTEDEEYIFSQEYISQEAQIRLNSIGARFVKELNATQMFPEEEVVENVSTDAVIQQIEQLRTECGELNVKLQGFSDRLKNLSQNGFSQDLERFRRINLSQRVELLNGLLKGLIGNANETFNLLSPKNKFQQSVVDAVYTMRNFETLLSGQLSEVILSVKIYDDLNCETFETRPFQHIYDQDLLDECNELFIENREKELIYNSITSELKTFLNVFSEKEVTPRSITMSSSSFFPDVTGKKEVVPQPQPDDDLSSEAIHNKH